MYGSCLLAFGVVWNKLGFDGINFNLCKGLTVAVFHAIAFTAFLFENDNFVPFDMAEDTGADAGSAYIGCSDGYFTIIFNKVHGVKGNLLAFLRCQPVDEDLLTFLNFVLLTGDGNNCEHVEYQ
jgi:hypothetical protein